MYQFTKETIINSNLDSNGTSTKFSGANGFFSVLRSGNFKATEVVSCYKNAYVAPVKEKIDTLTITGSYTASKIYRLNIKLNRVDSYTSDFANSMSRNFLEKFYEVTGAGTAAALVTALVAAINKENRLKDNVYFTAVDGGSAVLTLEAADEYTRFLNIDIQEVVNPTLTGYDAFTQLLDVRALAVTGSKLVAGKEGFGTVKQLTKNLRLPTLANTSWLAIGQDERPVPGGNYSQYTLKVLVDNGDQGGVSTIGQQTKSLTTAVFYVLSTLVSDWETALGNAGIPILAAQPGVGGFSLIYADSTIVAGDTAIPTVTGASGAVTFVSATTAKATIVAGTGVVTGVAAGTSVITATDAAGSTASFTITVIA